MTEMKYGTTGMYTRFKCTRFETDEKKQTFQRLTLYLFLPVTKTRTFKYYIRCQCTVFVGVRVSHVCSFLCCDFWWGPCFSSLQFSVLWFLVGSVFLIFVVFCVVWCVCVFDIYFTEFGAVLTTVLPVLFKYCYKYCYSDNRKL